MRGAVLVLAAAAMFGAARDDAAAQGTPVAQSTTVRFDRPIFTTEGTALCPRQHQITALRRALDDNDRAAFDRAAKDNGCKLAGPDIPLTVVARPGSYDPDVEVKVAGDAPSSDAGLPRGKAWTLKTMVRN